MPGKTWFSGLDVGDLFATKSRRKNRGDDNTGEVALKAWYWRLEVGVGLILFTPVLFLGKYGLLVDASLIGTLGWEPWRKRFYGALYRARIRRAWMKAIRDSGAADPPPGTARRVDSYLTLARPKKIKMTQVGELMTIAMPGRGARLLEQHQEDIARCLGIREVRLHVNPNNIGEANVLLVRHDPFDVEEPLRWPNVDKPTLSLWDWIPLGIDEDGGPLGVILPERHVLIGGESGSGKSVALSLLAATAGLDATAELSIVDGKDIEFAPWEPVADRFAGTNINHANRVLRQVQEDMDRRYEILGRHKVKKLTRENAAELGLGLHLLIIDELPHFVRMRATRELAKASDEFMNRLLSLVSRGRAAGIIVVTAAQRPDHETVDTSLRDLFGFRIAFRCNTPDSSDTILGRGWAHKGYDAATIPGRERGVGYVFLEEERPVRCKGCMLSDDEIEQLVARGAALRLSKEWESGKITPNDDDDQPQLPIN